MKHINYNKNLRIFFLILLAATIFACTERITIKTDNAKPLLCIYSMITSLDQHQIVNLSSTAPYFDDQPNSRVSGANVFVDDDKGNRWTFTELYEEGEYITSDIFSVIPGNNYKLTVECDFNQDGIKEIYTAESYAYNVIDIDSMRVEPMYFFNKNYYNTIVYVYEPPGQNYYMYRFYVNGLLVNDKISRYFITDDELFDGQYVSDISFNSFPNISEIDQYEEDDKNTIIFITPGDQLKIEMSEISKPFYNFLSQCKNEMNGENPFFGGPAANISTNISGGACGFFAVFVASHAECYVPKE